jgi:hypothetical protein
LRPLAFVTAAAAALPAAAAVFPAAVAARVAIAAAFVPIDFLPEGSSAIRRSRALT